MVFCWTPAMRLSDLHAGLFGALTLQPEAYTLHHLRQPVSVRSARRLLAELAIFPGSCVELRRLG